MIAIVRIVVAAASVALLLGLLINDFWPDEDGSGPGPSGRARLVRFLNSVYLPMLLIATVLAISVCAAVYVERLQLDLRRSVPHSNGSVPTEPPAGERPSANGDQPTAPWGAQSLPHSPNSQHSPTPPRSQPPVADDAIWKPTNT